MQEIDLTGVKLVLPKTKFSMVLPEVEAALAEIPGVRSVVLFGVEVSSLISMWAHNSICVRLSISTGKLCGHHAMQVTLMLTDKCSQFA